MTAQEQWVAVTWLAPHVWYTARTARMLELRCRWARDMWRAAQTILCRLYEDGYGDRSQAVAMWQAISDRWQARCDAEWDAKHAIYEHLMSVGEHSRYAPSTGEWA